MYLYTLAENGKPANMTVKELREWCDRMGDDARVTLSLRTYYCVGYTTKFVATNPHSIERVYGQGGPNYNNSELVIEACHSIVALEAPCPKCGETSRCT